MSILLVCGDRNWVDEHLIQEMIETIVKEGNVTRIINGAARGADKISSKIANKLNIECIEYPAKWDNYGRSAGYIRNQQMLDDGKPDIVLAFHDDIKKSKDTKDMITKSMYNNIITMLISH